MPTIIITKNSFFFNVHPMHIELMYYFIRRLIELKRNSHAINTSEQSIDFLPIYDN